MSKRQILTNQDRLWKKFYQRMEIETLDELIKRMREIYNGVHYDLLPTVLVGMGESMLILMDSYSTHYVKKISSKRTSIQHWLERTIKEVFKDKEIKFKDIISCVKELDNRIELIKHFNTTFLVDIRLIHDRFPEFVSSDSQLDERMELSNKIHKRLNILNEFLEDYSRVVRSEVLKKMA